MNKEPVLHKIQKEWHGTYKSYMIGFIASFLLTTLAFYLTIEKSLTLTGLIYTLIGLAVVQAIIQLIFFLHVGQETKPRFETPALLFSIVILFVIVVGSIWIMNDLNMRMMPDMMENMSHD